LYLSYATAPAYTIKKSSSLSKDIGAPILGKSSSSIPGAAVVAYSGGLVIVWDISKQAKEAVQFDVSYKDVQSLEPAEMSYYDDSDLKPKEAWIMDISDTTKSIIPPESSLNISTSSDYDVVLSSVALMGVPLSSKQPEIKSKSSNHVTPPPSVIVGGVIRQFNGSETPVKKTPVLLVYGLVGVEIQDDSKSDISASEIFKAIGTTGTTGTKQESQMDGDEELFLSSDMSNIYESEICKSNWAFLLLIIIVVCNIKLI